MYAKVRIQGWNFESWNTFSVVELTFFAISFFDVGLVCSLSITAGLWCIIPRCRYCLVQRVSELQIVSLFIISIIGKELENLTPFFHCFSTSPIPFFQDENSKISHFDTIFQHDGSNSVRYAPYSANSGFYYVRANKKTQYLFTSLLYHSDLILTWDSHQQALVQLLAEHSSLFGLNVKVFGRDTSMFPGML